MHEGVLSFPRCDSRAVCRATHKNVPPPHPSKPRCRSLMLHGFACQVKARAVRKVPDADKEEWAVDDVSLQRGLRAAATQRGQHMKLLQEYRRKQHPQI